MFLRDSACRGWSPCTSTRIRSLSRSSTRARTSPFAGTGLNHVSLAEAQQVSDQIVEPRGRNLPALIPRLPSRPAPAIPAQPVLVPVAVRQPDHERHPRAPAVDNGNPRLPPDGGGAPHRDGERPFVVVQRVVERGRRPTSPPAVYCFVSTGCCAASKNSFCRRGPALSALIARMAAAMRAAAASVAALPRASVAPAASPW